MLEWQRDWANRETYDAVMDIVKTHFGAYGIGVEYAYTMVRRAPATEFPEYVMRRVPLQIAFTALAMGTRNAAARKLAIPDLTTTVLTLTITSLAADSSFAGGSNPRWLRRTGSVLAMFLRCGDRCGGDPVLDFHHAGAGHRNFSCWQRRTLSFIAPLAIDG